MNHKSVKGVGINDADYRLNIWEHLGRENGKQRQKLIWRCPFYSVWMSMLDRCYSEKTLAKYPSYQDVYVCDEWLTFSNFKAWMERQDWEGKQLDKDVLIPRNNVYSAETCVFISELTNKFIEEGKPNGNNLPMGVSMVTQKKRIAYHAYCQQLGGEKRKYLGYYETVHDAHKAWLTEKRRLAKIVAEMQSDLRVVEAIIDRYNDLEKWSDRTIASS